MALTQASEGGLKISNAGTNGQYLQKQSGNAGGLTWADVPAGVGGATGLDLNDDVKLRLGTGNDLEIYHSGSHGYILNNTGNLVIRAKTGETGIEVIPDGAVQLRYDNSTKCETTNSGLRVYGNLDLEDSEIIRLGTGDDFQIYHSGGVNYIDSLNSSTLRIRQATGDINANFITDGAVELYYDNSKKFETHGSGVSVFGQLSNSTSGIGSAFADNTKAAYGTGDDLQIYHNGTHNYIDSTNGKIHIRHGTDNAIQTIADGAVELYYDNAKKFETYSGGCIVTGQLSTDAISLGDSEKILIGTGDDLQIYHDGTDAIMTNATGDYDISTAGTRRVHIASGGHITFQKDVTDIGTVGQTFTNSGELWLTRNNGIPFSINRLDSDGQLIRFHQAGAHEGNISVSGSTISYNGGHLSRWSQLKGLSTTDKSARPTIYQGTVLSNLDDLCEWDGETNQQLNMTKVSDVAGDKNVAGVFWAWDNDPDDTVTNVNDFYIAMTGDMVIRVAGSTTVARGDLLISSDDGTAKPQADDIIRSNTIAKIISTNSTATYADGSKAYPCVLMAC